MHHPGADGAADADHEARAGRHVLRSGSTSVEVDSAAGGRIAQISIDGRGVLRGPEHAHLGWASWGWYPLVPWSNRLPGGQLVVDGQRCQFRINWPDGTAIHGLAADTAWRATAQSADAVQLEVRLTAECYDVEATQRIVCREQSVEQTLEIVNRATRAVPAGIGIHPWFAVAPVRVPAEQAWPGDDPLPSGPPRPVQPHEDLRKMRLAPPMDRCFSGLTANAAQIGDLTLAWDGPICHVVVYSGEPGWVCVEPVTMTNNGFELHAAGVPGTGVTTLEPDASLGVTYSLSW